MDARIAVWMATHRVAILNDPSVWLGTIEKLGAVWILFALLLGAYRRLGVLRTLALGVITALTTFLADALSFLAKDATHRTRPFVAHHQIHPLYVVHSSSFPAGHAATAFAGAVLLAVLAAAAGTGVSPARDPDRPVAHLRRRPLSDRCAGGRRPRGPGGSRGRGCRPRLRPGGSIPPAGGTSEETPNVSS